MAKENKLSKAVRVNSLTEKQISKYNRETSFSLLYGEFIIVLQGAEIFMRTLMDEKGIKTDKDGDEISVLYVLGLVLSEDLTQVRAELIPLSFLLGKVLYEEDKVSLQKCKETDNLCAATWLLPKVQTSPIETLHLEKGTGVFPDTICLQGGDIVSGYKAPEFSEIWESPDKGKTWQTRESVKGLTEIPLRKGTTRTLVSAKAPAVSQAWKKLLVHASKRIQDGLA